MSKERKIQEFVVKGKEIFIGLEDSKKTWRICVRMEKMIIHQKSMEAEYDVLKSYLNNKFPDCKIHLVYEAGFRGFNLHDQLTADGHNCIVVPAHKVHQEKCSRVKNDQVDARILAKNLEDGNCTFCHVPDEELRNDREIVRTLNAVQKDIKRTKSRIRMAFYKYGVKTGITAKSWTDNHYKYVRTLELPPILGAAMEPFYQLLDLLWKNQKDLRNMLRGLAKKERYANAYRIARSLPGIGWLTAIRLILELGEDFERFKSGAAIASFVGLGGSEYSTGEKIRKGGITKQGNSFVRSCLIESAWAAIRYDPVLQDFYLRMKRNTAIAQKAITAVARKLIVRMRSCIVNNVEYRFGVIE